SLCFFFFSSRRRHTRFSRDWSSDVCFRSREIIPELLPMLDRPFAFFGHCMGSIIMFEVAQLLQSEHNKVPVHLFAGGSMAPHLRSEERRVGKECRSRWAGVRCTEKGEGWR